MSRLRLWLLPNDPLLVPLRLIEELAEAVVVVVMLVIVFGLLFVCSDDDEEKIRNNPERLVSGILQRGEFCWVSAKQRNPR